MKLTRIQVERMVRKVLKDLKEQNAMTVKVTDEKLFQHAVGAILKDLQRESELDKEVNHMLDDLERQTPGEFQRFKMFHMLKKRLAQEKGIIL